MKNKTKRYRGYTTHGRGSRKKGRGKGEKGGSGRGGSKHKHLKGFWGRRGFTYHGVKHTVKTINVGKLQEMDEKEINLTEMGYDKLLGAGLISREIKVIVPAATARAVEKVSAAGGDVVTE